MSSKLDTLDMVIYGAGLLLFIGLMASVICSVLDNQSVANEVANTVTSEVTNKVTSEVTNTVTNTMTNEAVNNTAIVTETEVYKVVCTSDGEGYCKEYSVRKITKE